MEFKNRYTARHDRVVDLMEEELLKLHPTSHLLKNKIIDGGILHVDSPLFSQLNHRKPDLFILNHAQQEVFIIEVSTPFDAFVQQCYETKFDYYKPLADLITLFTPYRCRVIILIIGSTGCAHTRLVPGLKLLGFGTRKSKALAKYLCLSVSIGSSIVWKMRGMKVLA